MEEKTPKLLQLFAQKKKPNRELRLTPHSVGQLEYRF
jgi:hypothetical protein